MASRKVPPNPQTVSQGLRPVPLLLRLSGIAIVAHVVWNYGFHVGYPRGISMMPTIAQDGDQVLIDKTKRRGKNVKVGDIVSFKHPIMPYHAIKRVVATPGDFVLAGTPRAKGGPLAGQMIQVPPGHCFVAGDNQQYSRDSRMFGPLPLALITGKVTMILWPPSSFGALGSGLKEPEPEK